MAKNIYGNDQNSPFSWQSGDTSTFTDQSNNLAQQAGEAGLNTGEIQVQNETAKAAQKAGQSGQNVAAGSSDVAKGAEVTPTVAQDGSPQIQPYQETKAAPAAPDTTITNNTDFSKNSNLDDPIQDYLKSIFPNGIPQSVLDAMGNSINQTAPNSDGSWGGNAQQAIAQNQIDNGGGLVDAYNDYLKNIQQGVNDQANSPLDTQQYQNYIQNKYAEQLNNLNQLYGQGQNDLATQTSDKQKAISDYINNLQTGLKNYQDRTGDLSNVGVLSDLEKDVAAKNALLASTTSGSEALTALTHGQNNSKLNALSQQAESAAIQKAQGEAAAAQQNAKTGQEILTEGQKAQAKGYKDAGDTISKNQTDTLNKLQQSGTAAQKALQDAYNNSKTNLSKQEQDYVNKAQDTLKNAKIPESNITDATNAFANVVKGYLDKGNLSNDQKNNIKRQMESIWRIAVGSNPSDINFSHQIAGILNPLLQSLGESADFDPNK